MARPTNLEQNAGGTDGENGDGLSVQAGDKYETSSLEASGKDPKDETTQDSASKDGGSTSDNDTGERPVREKLRETSIAGIPDAPLPHGGERASSPDDMSIASQQSPSAGIGDTNSVDGRGRSTRKRSFDDIQTDDHDGESGESNNDGDSVHRRKKSRESTPGDSADDAEKPADTSDNKHENNVTTPPDDTQNTDSCAIRKIMSPKKKRSRDQFDNDLKGEDLVDKSQDEETTSSPGGPDNSETSSNNARRAKGEPEKKRHRDNSQDRDSETGLSTAKIPSTNAFSNTSAVSPFASLASPKPSSSTASEKTSQVTSPSAFASSGLAAFAGSDKSPFGALGASASTSGFGPAPSTETKKTEPKGFAGTPLLAPSSASPFASTGTSGFGKLGGSGFGGSAFGGGFAGTPQSGGLTSFAAPTGPAVLGASSTKSKPFGAAADDDEEDEDRDKVEKPCFEGLEDEKEDDRFFKRDTETGEEGEETYFSCKAKLFHFDGKEWKERGLGTFKLNVTRGSGENPNLTARLIMRADGALRVILNSPVFKGMTVGDVSGGEPTTKQVHLASLEDGRSVPLLLRTGSNDLAKGLYNKIESLKKIL